MSRRIALELERDDTKEQSCLYDVIFCGALRGCIFFKGRRHSQRKKKIAHRVGMSLLVFITVVTGTFMELSHWPIWSEWFASFAPHYS